MKILVITNLYPNACQPGRSVFNQQQIERLSRRCDLRVIAPLPWFPKGMGLTPPPFAGAPAEETINGIQVYHPRYLVTPKIGRSFYGWFLYQAMAGLIRKIRCEFPFDVIFATWAYPDCYAASIIAEKLDKPLVCKVHGSDINIIAEYPSQRRMIRGALRSASSVVCVTRALKQKIEALGIEASKAVVIPNGVDQNKFQMMDRSRARAELDLSDDKKYILFIGNLTPVKGLKYLIEAMRQVEHAAQLIILGDGELRGSLENMISSLDLRDRIRMPGRKQHREIVTWMNAADVLCLPSLNEGCPNVILEAMACGLPVVASDTGGIPDLITSDELGFLSPPGDSAELAKRLKQALEKSWNRDKITACARAFDWDAGVDRIMELFQEAMGKHHA